MVKASTTQNLPGGAFGPRVAQRSLKIRRATGVPLKLTSAFASSSSIVRAGSSFWPSFAIPVNSSALTERFSHLAAATRSSSRSERTGTARTRLPVIVNTGGYRMTWVGFPEQDQTIPFVLPRSSAIPVAICFRARVLADTPEGRGPVGVAIRTGEICIIHNTLKDPALRILAGRAAEEKFLSVICSSSFRRTGRDRLLGNLFGRRRSF